MIAKHEQWDYKADWAEVAGFKVYVYKTTSIITPPIDYGDVDGSIDAMVSEQDLRDFAEVLTWAADRLASREH